LWASICHGLVRLLAKTHDWQRGSDGDCVHVCWRWCRTDFCTTGRKPVGLLHGGGRQGIEDRHLAHHRGGTGSASTRESWMPPCVIRHANSKPTSEAHIHRQLWVPRELGQNKMRPSSPPGKHGSDEDNGRKGPVFTVENTAGGDHAADQTLHWRSASACDPGRSDRK